MRRDHGPGYLGEKWKQGREARHSGKKQQFVQGMSEGPPVPGKRWVLMIQQRTEQALYPGPSHSNEGRHSLYKFKMLQSKEKLNKRLEGMGRKRLFRLCGQGRPLLGDDI